MLEKWVVVTGASTGIGRATAHYLAARGYSVLAGVRRSEDGAALAANNKAITPILLDVTQREHVDACAAEVCARTGTRGLYALVNNAGINYIAPFELSNEQRARKLFEVNFFGLCAMTQALIPALRTFAKSQHTTSKIVNVGSFGSTMGIPWEPYYHASKFAVLGLSESLMFELKRQKIRVAAILPGGINTEFFAKTGLEIDAAISTLPDAHKSNYLHGLTALKRPFSNSNRWRATLRLWLTRSSAQSLPATHPSGSLSASMPT
jgi:NAD(P)-dependent dehydrogenase (short-subunit alcohol dehydrogenase family)